jgi:RNA polymerase sigma-70 factor, ECF subfamily
MIDTPSPNVTNLLVAWSKGDQQAFGTLMLEVQNELHSIAARYMAGERPGHDLQATALINEAYLRLVDWKDIQWADRAHFFGMAANMMRRVLVDHARSRGRVKRGGEAIHVSLAEAADMHTAVSADVLALDDVLRRLEELDPRAQEPDRGDALLRGVNAGGNRRSARRFCGDGQAGLDARARFSVQ